MSRKIHEAEGARMLEALERVWQQQGRLSPETWRMIEKAIVAAGGSLTS